MKVFTSKFSEKATKIFMGPIEPLGEYDLAFYADHVQQTSLQVKLSQTASHHKGFDETSRRLFRDGKRLLATSYPDLATKDRATALM